MAPLGHWHVYNSKTLTFTVTDEAEKPLTGLSSMITVKTLSGTVDRLEATDNGDGTYTADYSAQDLGSGYASAYTVAFSFEHNDSMYADAWPAEVVRDGNERIMPTIRDKLYSYQVRYAWDPGIVAAGNEVTMYFEPRRAIQTGDELNTQQPWRNTFNHITDDLSNISVVVETDSGSQVAMLTPTYTGLGVYRAKYTPDSPGEYKVSFLFTDRFNRFTVDKAETSYPLVVE
jgi:hypothetical protein